MSTPSFSSAAPHIRRRQPRSTGYGALPVLLVVLMVGAGGTFLGLRLQEAAVALVTTTTGYEPITPPPHPLNEPLTFGN